MGAWVLALSCWVLLAVAASAAPQEALLRQAIERFVLANAPAPPSAVDVPPLADFVVGAEAGGGEIEIELSTNPRERFQGRVPVTVALRSGGRELKRGVVTVGVKILRPVLVAARSIRRGERPSARDVRVEPRDLAELEGRPFEDWLGSAEALLGRRARRSLRAGEPIAAAWLESAPLVERGQTVRIELERGALRIEAAGEARAAGREGDWVEVLNRDSRRKLVGRVGPDGAVHVAF
jgi:flagella basal body P-ring formation protein FlgA